MGQTSMAIVNRDVGVYDGAMSMTAITAFIRELIERMPDKTQVGLARAMGKSPRQVNRWLGYQDAEQEDRAAGITAADLFRGVQYLGVSIEEVFDLFLKAQGAEAGRARAAELFPVEPPAPDVAAVLAAMPAHQRASLGRVLDILQHDPQRAALLIEVGRALAESERPAAEVLETLAQRKQLPQAP